MDGPASAFAALGLEPGADRAAVEEAYRRLIKLHHPDRSGGNAQRAAEINRAYFELRRQPEQVRHEGPEAPLFRPSGRPRSSRRKRRRSGIWPVLILVLAIALLIEWPRLAEQAPRWMETLAALRPPVPASSRASVVHIDSSAIDGPLFEPVIADAIRQATRLATGDAEALARHSRDCHRQMRSTPQLAQLDRCAAFDDAVAAIADRESLDDRGTFSASAVTARQMTAASLLSSDYLAIERRLDRIRTMVQLTVRPRLPPLPPPVVEDEPPLAPDPI